MCGEDDCLVVRSSVDQADWASLLHSIRQERCAHSWRNFSADGTFEQLVAWENALRPTTLFFYYCHPDIVEDSQTSPPGELRLAAVATVAAAIRREFPFAGLPVLARCYILPHFRGRGLYRRIVRHRFSFCRAHLGDRLRAVHIGTADERAAHALTSNTPGWPRFVRIGAELIHAGEDICRVGAFLHFTPSYAEELLRNVSAPDATPEQMALCEELSQLIAGVPGDHALAACRLYKQLQNSGALTGRNLRALDQLMTLCTAIPLAGMESTQ